MSSTDHPVRQPALPAIAPSQAALPAALLLVFALFAVVSPGFLSGPNLLSVLVNGFTPLVLVSLAMTLAVGSGGIDLSVGTAIDFASFAFVASVLHGQPVWLGLIEGIAAGSLVGLFNALLISGVGVSPFLATLGTLFVGRSVQQLLTGGGNPVYLPQTSLPEAFRFLGHGTFAGVPVSLTVAVTLAIAAWIVLQRSRAGRAILYIGVQPEVVRYSGVTVRRHIALTYILGAALAAVAGLVLSSTVAVYIPNSGNGFLMNAIGATFIGTTLSRYGRPNVPGTVLGVFLLSMVANGLLLSGLNFYWQQVGTGALILIVLGVSAVSRRQQALAQGGLRGG